MKRANAWIFDLDDTLMSNVHDYAYPILDACKLVIDTLGDSTPHVSVRLGGIGGQRKRLVRGCSVKVVDSM